MGKYSDELNRSRINMSPEQITNAKNSKKKARAAYRKEENLKIETERVRLTPEAQLQALDFRLGKGVGAQTERKRLNIMVANNIKYKKKDDQKKELQKDKIRGKQANAIVVDDSWEAEVKIEDKGPKIAVPIIPWSELKKAFIK